jgi:hypothetical protein
MGSTPAALAVLFCNLAYRAVCELAEEFHGNRLAIGHQCFEPADKVPPGMWLELQSA